MNMIERIEMMLCIYLMENEERSSNAMIESLVATINVKRLLLRSSNKINTNILLLCSQHTNIRAVNKEWT